MSDFESTLAHFGVKGMHWGQRKAHTSTASERQVQLKKIQRSLDKIDADRAIAGLTLIGYYQKKMFQKEVAKNPKFNYSKLPPEKQKAFKAEARRRATRAVAFRGAVEAGVLVGGGLLLVSAATTPGSSAARSGKIGVASLGATALKARVSEFRDIQIAKNFDELSAQRDKLKKGEDI